MQLFIGKGHVYNGVRTDLKGERADFQVQTGYLVQNTQLLDINYIVNHIGKKTTSNVTADGTLKDAAVRLILNAALRVQRERKANRYCFWAMMSSIRPFR